MAFCPIVESCGVFSIDQLKVHLQLSHRFDFHTALECKQENCGRPFDGWSEYRRHLDKFHC